MPQELTVKKDLQEHSPGLGSLDAFETILVSLVSVIYTGVGAEQIAAGLSGSSVPALAVRTDVVSSVGAALRRLRHRNLIDGQNRCRADLVETITRTAVANGLFPELCALARRTVPLPDFVGPRDFSFYQGCIREMRIAIHAGDLDLFSHYLLPILEYRERKTLPHPIVAICNTPFAAGWFRSLPAQIQLYGLHEILKDALTNLMALDGPLLFLEDRNILAGMPEAGRPSFYYVLVMMLFLQGRLDEAAIHLAEAGVAVRGLGLWGLYHALRGDYGKAIELFEDDLVALREDHHSDDAFFPGLEGVYYLLCLLKEHGLSRLGTIERLLIVVREFHGDTIFYSLYSLFEEALHFLENPLDAQFSQAYQTPAESPPGLLHTLFLSLFILWFDGFLPDWLRSRCAALLTEAKEKRFGLFAAEFADILDRATGKSGRQGAGKSGRSDGGRIADARDGAGATDRMEEVSRAPGKAQERPTGLAELGMVTLATTLPFVQPWQRALKALSVAGISNRTRPDDQGDSRLSWFISLEGDSVAIMPKSQKMLPSGLWSRGKTVSLKKLIQSENLATLVDRDRKICAAIKFKKLDWGMTCELDSQEALPMLVGHPYVYIDGPVPRPVAIMAGKPEVRVTEGDQGFHITFAPELAKANVQLVRESPGKCTVIEINRHHRRLARVIGPKGLTIPLAGKKKMTAMLGNIAPHVTIHSPLDGSTAGIRRIDADNRIYVHLKPVGKGFAMELGVKPFGPSGPYQKPGWGAKSVIAEIDGERLQAIRDLEAERRLAEEIEALCPDPLSQEVAEYEWLFERPDDCLYVLQGLQQRVDQVVVEWPEGRRLAVSPSVSFEQLHLKIAKKNNWFELQGHIDIDNTLALEFGKLLNIVQKTSSRFIPLGKGQFLALSEEFRKRLAELGRYIENGARKNLLHPLAMGAVSGLTASNAIIETDQAWDDMVRRIKEAGEQTPALPATFNAELRDYQLEGFHWLWRLSYLGFGGCLADDMGLGKTIQALAIILARAQGGPTLVVAPTSVCMNWANEAGRFAPTIKVIMLEGRQRKRLIANLQPFDLMIASYGLLQQETEALTAIEWETIVLDEGQAIKNLATKRSVAAKQLNGKFRLITTGTPIENHLGELWNLLHFLNPGLLGSLDRFNERFAVPIEKNGSKEAKRSLKKLIKPFILRRTKSQVLDELPSRTEITLHVELSRKEITFYETLRRRALERIKEMQSFSQTSHVRILAEIMKLRLACCHPRLVSETVDIPCSKMELFDEIVDELLQNRHRALVFSQFVGYLKIVRSHLDARGISYQYLDGSTPKKDRQLRVDAFQAGQGDLFLISLKAGGLGLNLTGADYVIHMDPWWNPAVEDQASDRAHRLGQLRPVTIYRLITRNTIEEKIIALHRNKRELAGSLLEGSEASGRITTDELLRLLEEGSL